LPIYGTIIIKVNHASGVGKTGTGQKALEENKIYHKNYPVYIYILYGCIIVLLLLRHQVCRLKGTELKSFCVNYASKKKDLCDSEEETTRALASDTCDYLVINYRHHLRRLIIVTLGEMSLLLIVASEIVFLARYSPI
jgi:hypothetical protein